MQGKVAKSLAGSAARMPVKYVKGVNKMVDKGCKKLTKSYTPKGSAARGTGSGASSYQHSQLMNVAKNTIAKPIAHSMIATAPNIGTKNKGRAVGWGTRFDPLAAHKAGWKLVRHGQGPIGNKKGDKHRWSNTRTQGDGGSPKNIVAKPDCLLYTSPSPRDRG